MHIARKQAKRSSPQSTNMAPRTPTVLNIPTTVVFDITDIHCGTLITGEAMRNMHKENSIIPSDDKFGVIAYCLMDKKDYTSFKFTIDIEKKKLAIIGETALISMDCSDKNTELKFEWNFRE